MEDLSLHILDVAENSIEAKAKTIGITLFENRKKDILILEIDDDGQGMDQEMTQKVLDPFFTTKKTRGFGLGLSLLAEAARAANGDFTINSQPGKGTKIKASFQLSHIDMKPLGDIPQTMVTLILSHPEIEFRYRHQVNDSTYSLTTQEIKDALNGIPLHSPEVITFIKNNLKEGIANIRRKK